MVIAGAFIVDPLVGVLATLAVMAHEIPHEVGDFMILLNAGFTRRRAFFFNLVSGSAAVAGGVIGYFVLEHVQGLLPYALAIAAASFIYIALSDLLPEMMRRSRLREVAAGSRRWCCCGVLIALARHRRLRDALKPTEAPASCLPYLPFLPLLAGRHRPCRIRHPLAPRARIQRRAAETGDAPSRAR